MVDRVSRDGALAREALLAAMKGQAERAEGFKDAARAISQEPKIDGGEASSFGQELGARIEALDSSVKRVDDLPKDLLTGKIEDFHEVAVQIKKAEFSFRFAMEIRNKLLDAYREVMRMNV